MNSSKTTPINAPYNPGGFPPPPQPRYGYGRNGQYEPIDQEDAATTPISAPVPPVPPADGLPGPYINQQPPLNVHTSGILVPKKGKSSGMSMGAYWCMLIGIAVVAAVSVFLLLKYLA